MKWTSETPKKSGWYWLKSRYRKSGNLLKEVVFFKSEIELMLRANFDALFLRDFENEVIGWSGPIPEPEEGV